MHLCLLNKSTEKGFFHLNELSFTEQLVVLCDINSKSSMNTSIGIEYCELLAYSFVLIFCAIP